jgi:dTDP-glucose 4,6-dehydratase
MSILVTGGSGFIGSNFIEYVLNNTTQKVINVDSLTYAGASYLPDSPRYTFYNHSIGDKVIADVLEHHRPDYIVNFAAETHVDRSINDPFTFVNTNILSTYNFICTVQEYYATKNSRVKMIHVSTDEVYGSLNFGDTPFTENSQYAPNSPYSATKASGDHLIRSFNKTYGLPAVIVNCSNNYGPRQHPEKFIPTIIANALNDQPVPIYGTGLNMRDWLYVKDNCEAIFKVLAEGVLGSRYNIGANANHTNLQVARTILMMLDKPQDLIEFVEDRKGHDFRYAVDSSHIKNTLGWEPSTSFENGLTQTVEWYVKNMEWVEQCKLLV